MSAERLLHYQMKIDNHMNEDKKVDSSNLPKQTTRTTTQQPEEFIDKSSVDKDELDVPTAPGDESGDTRRHEGNQETA